MCNQAVGLAAAELERRGVATVALQLLRFVAERVRPPRGLCVPFRHGYPLGLPGDARLQHAVLEACWRLLEEATAAPALADFTPSGQAGEFPFDGSQEGTHGGG